MARTSDNALLLSLVVGGALYWYWQQQQNLDTQTGVGDSISGDIGTLTQNVSNYVQQNTIGSTRGERNNNPGNINLRNGAGTVINWQGLSAKQTDSRFAQFDNVAYGIRALHKNILTIFGRGADTVQKIVSAWAPPSDGNNTAAYIANVCTRTGFAPAQQIDMTDATTAAAVCNAVIIQENGSNPYVATGQFAQGMALS